MGAETVRVGRTALPPSLGNPFTAAGRPSSGLWIAMYDGLSQIGPGGTLEPALALSWQNTSATTWVFRLRPNVSFHNGEPFTAAAVVATINFLLSEEGRGLFVGAEMRGVASIRSIDDLTVEFTTTVPDPILPKRLSIVYIVDPGTLARAGIRGVATQPVGTGPFQLVDWGDTTRRTVFRAAETSWRKANIDGLEMIMLPDASTRLQALLSDQIDIMEGFSPDDADVLIQRPYRHHSTPAPQVMSLAFRNMRDGDAPLNDKRVRQALNYAVNRQQIAGAIGHGRVEAASQGTVQGVFGYNPDLQPYPYDPARAKALLVDAGYPDGFSITVEVITGFVVSDSLVYQSAVQDLAAIGVDVDLRAVPYATWLGRFISNDWHDTDAFSFVSTALFYDTSRSLSVYSCDRDPPFFCEPDFMKGYREADREMDPVKREQKLKHLMAEMKELAPALWLTTVTHDYAVHERIQGFAAGPMGIMYDRIRLQP